MQSQAIAIVALCMLVIGCPAPPAPAPVPAPTQQPSAAPAPVRPGEVRSIVASDGTSCAVTAKGSVWCWGDVFDGYSYAPLHIEGLPPAEQIAVGYGHACVLTQQREVWCWGREPFVSYKKKPEKAPSPLIPQRIEGLTAVRALDAGGRYSCVIDASEQVRCWKWGARPIRLRGLGRTSMVRVGNEHACALAGGAMHCWGHLAFDYSSANTEIELQVGAPGAIVNIAVGDGGHCAQLQDGHLYCWAKPCTRGRSWSPSKHRRKHQNYLKPRNPRLQPLPRNMQPRPVTEPCVLATPAARLQALDVGDDGLVCGVLDGEIRCWKRGKRTPQHVGRYRDVELGADHGCALTNTGEVACWGNPRVGRLGRSPWLFHRYRVPLASAHAALDHGMACWLAGDRGVRCWSHNSYPAGSKGTPLRGELLSGTEQAQSLALLQHQLCVTFDGAPPRCTRRAAPHAIELEDARAVVMSWRVRCAITTGGGVVCDRRLGKLAAGEVTVGESPLRDVVSLDTGLQHVCAVSGGRVYCWGLGSGRGEHTFAEPPRAIDGVEGASAVATANASSCALAAGRVWCWGAGGAGQLGDGLFRSRMTPRPIEGLTGIRLLHAGALHYCALDEQDAVWCWGSNSDGQLGDGTTRSSGRPIKLTGVSGAKGLALGRGGSCVIRERDSLCWGTSASWAFASQHLDRAPKAIAVVPGIGAPRPVPPPPPVTDVSVAEGSR